MLQRLFSPWRRLTGRREQASIHSDERRVWLRHPHRLEATLQSATEPPFSARVQNISRGGIKLVVDRRIEAGELVCVDLPCTNPPGSSMVLACVLRAKAEPRGGWALSCSFATELSDADLAQFGVRPACAGRVEKRAHARHPCQAQVTFEVVGATGQDSASVSNISAMGIGLVVSRPLAVGSLLSLELKRADGQRVLTMLASIVRAQPTPEGNWTLGCNFIGELSEATLRSLV
jgi:hypothetical protein